jgi:hypothetical protein
MSHKVDLRNRISAILLSDAAQKIDFRMGDERIDGSAFRAVWFALQPKPPDGDPGIEIAVGGVSDDQEAFYHPGLDTFMFRDWNAGFAKTSQATVIHESVHAWHDLRVPKIITTGNRDDSHFRTWALSYAKLGVMPSLRSEAMAYVAESLYDIYKWTKKGDTPVPPPYRDADKLPSTHALFWIAWDIAEDIMNKPGVKVPDSVVSGLEYAIRQHPGHAKLKADPSLLGGFDGLARG